MWLLTIQGNIRNYTMSLSALAERNRFVLNKICFYTISIKKQFQHKLQKNIIRRLGLPDSHSLHLLRPDLPFSTLPIPSSGNGPEREGGEGSSMTVSTVNPRVVGELGAPVLDISHVNGKYESFPQAFISDKHQTFDFDIFSKFSFNRCHWKFRST